MSTSSAHGSMVKVGLDGHEKIALKLHIWFTFLCKNCLDIQTGQD